MDSGQSGVTPYTYRRLLHHLRTSPPAREASRNPVKTKTRLTPPLPDGQNLETERRSSPGATTKKSFAEKAVETAFRLKCPTSHPPQSRHRPLRPLLAPDASRGPFSWAHAGPRAPLRAPGRIGSGRAARCARGRACPRGSAARSGPSRCRRSPRPRVPRD